MEKREFRRLVKERFKAISEEQKQSKSRAVVEQLRWLLSQREALVVALFAPMADLIERVVAWGEERAIMTVISLAKDSEQNVLECVMIFSFSIKFPPNSTIG